MTLAVGSLSPAIVAAVIAGVVSVGTTLATKLWLDRRSHRDQLQTDYEYEQRRALRGLIGKCHGRMLDTATSWHHRMANLYANHARLDVAGDYAQPRLYFDTSVYRFLALETNGRLFEFEQVFIDARVVGASDLNFVKFVQALHWVMCDGSLFDGLGYDSSHSTDHLKSDQLRGLCEAFAVDGVVPTFRTFEARLSQDPALRAELDPVLVLFDGLSPNEDRLRWDRFVCLHLLTIAFMREFAYEWLRPSAADAANAVQQLQHPQVAANLVKWLPVLGLAGLPALRDIEELLAVRAGGRASAGGPVTT